eukprot:GEMP01042395.1.p1 GENE.GEMP01042395.1~~GEMP01042395.1.p1  ORF type:complete len:351 (+),score=92.81 GEMP01042395.1:47-1099(+)
MSVASSGVDAPTTDIVSGSTVAPSAPSVPPSDSPVDSGESAVEDAEKREEKSRRKLTAREREDKRRRESMAGEGEKEVEGDEGTTCPWLDPGSVSPEDQALLSTLTVTAEQSYDFFYNVQQRDNATNRPTKAWLQARRYRLTSSRFEHVLHEGTRRKVLEIMASWPPPEAAQGAELVFGITHEHKAREAYEAMMGVTVREVGVLISRKLPWLGASPDGLVEYDGNVGLLEIKTQQFGMLHNIEDQLRKKPYIMKQIMGALRLVRDVLPEVNWCDLFFWSPCDEPQVQRIYWDEKVWMDMYPSIHYFYFSLFLPLWRKWESGKSKNSDGKETGGSMLQVLHQPMKKKRRRK